MTVKDHIEFKKKLRPKPIEVELKYIKGEKGDRSLPGKKGDKGDPGLTGVNGLDGLNGKDGRDGVDGTNGLNGDNGKAVELIAKKDKLYWKHEGEEWVFLATMPKGERGPRGAGEGLVEEVLLQEP